MSKKDSYMTAYDCNSDAVARNEAPKLLRRDDISERINELSKPLQNIAVNTAINEREKKRAILWDLIQNGDDNIKCRALDILNRMDAEYINITKTVDNSDTNISTLDVNTLKRLSGTG